MLTSLKKFMKLKNVQHIFMRSDPTAKGWIFLVTEPNPPPMPPLPPWALAAGFRNLPPGGVVVGLKIEDLLCSAPHLSTIVYKKNHHINC